MTLLWKYVISLFAKTWQPEKCKMVIVVRTDIYMGTGKIAAQCAHAALECYRQTINSYKSQQLFKYWLQSGQPKIILRITNENELLSIANKSQSTGLVTVVVRDAGRTQLEAGTITALGIGPAPNAIINNLTGHLKLL